MSKTCVALRNTSKKCAQHTILVKTRKREIQAASCVPFQSGGQGRQTELYAAALGETNEGRFCWRRRFWVRCTAYNAAAVQCAVYR